MDEQTRAKAEEAFERFHGMNKKEHPLVDGLRQAADGKWYLPDPNRPGKYLEVVESKGGTHEVRKKAV